MAGSMHLTSEHAIGIVEWRPLFYDHAENVKHQTFSKIQQGDRACQALFMLVKYRMKNCFFVYFLHTDLQKG